MSKYRVTLIPGDGTGPEVIREGLKVLNAASEKFGFSYKDEVFDYGGARYLKTGKTLTPKDIAALKKFDAIYLGAIGHPDVKPGILEQGRVLEFANDVFINPPRLLGRQQFGFHLLAVNLHCELVDVRAFGDGEYEGAFQPGRFHGLPWYFR